MQRAIDKVIDCFAEPIFILDGEHHRCDNCRFKMEEYCLFYMEERTRNKCVMWEGERK